MAYTVKKLALLSGVSVRTLHWYDEVGLLKPSFVGANGYRYYEEEQLLTLQQILFFRELGFELKQIRKVMSHSNFDKVVALTSHKQVLQNTIATTKKLIKTIDKTVKHLKGDMKMSEKEMFLGFNKEEQIAYEKQIIERFGEEGKARLKESKNKIAKRSTEEMKQLGEECKILCQEFVVCLEEGESASSPSVQALVDQHFKWLSCFWTPDKTSYAEHGQFILESDLNKYYEAFHQDLPEFVAKGIQYYAKNAL
ncbi:MAG: hypothetical protein SP1CHLAM54_03630 [Chlamydiia bacterium]|nr:hypothetical protein [Chlamydiia bacterium]MCH9615279.1 hypothetical protein [Chlamydiia bacterium]MCH9628399.1 hypothetical protein [Chlamydiia bacterium]